MTSGAIIFPRVVFVAEAFVMAWTTTTPEADVGGINKAGQTYFLRHWYVQLKGAGRPSHYMTDVIPAGTVHMIRDDKLFRASYLRGPVTLSLHLVINHTPYPKRRPLIPCALTATLVLD